MEEIISLIFNGCKFARDLEKNLPSLANQPDTLSKLCDEIARTFTAARDRVNAQGSTSNYGQTDHQMLSELSGGLQEFLIRYGSSQAAMGLLQTQLLAAKGETYGLEIPGNELGGRSMEGSPQFGGGGAEVQAMDVLDSGRASSSQRARRRKDEVNRRRELMPAPQMGNTEIPPDDGHTWRKYGQKEILRSKYPRSYYRCTHQRTYQCPAKKQVQRLDNDPNTFQVIYYGDHTCHMSSTAPSSVPTEMIPHITQQPTTTLSPPPPPPPPSAALLGDWLSININPATDPQVQMYRNFGQQISTQASGSTMVGGGGGGPSTILYRGDADYNQHQVVDLADAMFNSGSSGSNSMEFIFPSTEDHNLQERRRTNH